MQRFKALPWSVLPVAFAWLLLTTGCSTLTNHSPSASATPQDVTFPDPAKSTLPEGAFVSPENLRQVTPGMTKNQLYKLLGTPHFDEGVFGVKQWNYILNFRRDDGEADFSRCQYQIDFDSKHRVQTTHWKPESCRLIVDKPKPASAPVAQVATAPAPASMPTLPSDPIRLSADALFAFNSADLTDDGRESLGQFMQEVLVASQLEDILVVGYTDRIGSKKANLRLSKQRAESVQGYLIQGGVPASAIHSEGRGDANPVVKCTDKNRTALVACLSPNRRVELSGSTRQK
jgi:outer membrane protein OmpA-like peptidoglycan-associated protein